MIGKMCKKEKSSKYFLNHKDEDNRMVIYESGEEMISQEDKAILQERYDAFKEHVLRNIYLF